MFTIAFIMICCISAEREKEADFFTMLVATAIAVAAGITLDVITLEILFSLYF